MIRRMLRVDPYGDFFRYRTGQRLKKLLSPRWIAHRIAASAYALRHPEAPWLVPEALEAIAKRLRHEDKVFEWGTGLSTPWLAERAGWVIAVEHNPAWAKKTGAMLEQRGLRNVEVRLVDEPRYLAQIEPVEDGSLDLVLVDGILSGRALGLSMPKLRAGGLLALNRAWSVLPSDSATPDARTRADGPEDSVDPLAFMELQNWALKWFSDGINDTAIFTKP